MAEKKRGWRKKADFHPGGEKGKLHREIGVSEGEKIPATKLEAAEHSSNPEIKRDAIRAKTMEGWHHGKAKTLYNHPRSEARRKSA